MLVIYPFRITTLINKVFHKPQMLFVSRETIQTGEGELNLRMAWVTVHLILTGAELLAQQIHILEQDLEKIVVLEAHVGGQSSFNQMATIIPTRD